MYFSLQFLSLSDAVVLRFLAPILTGFSGALFLKESLSPKELIAGREHFMKSLTSIAIYVVQYAVSVELS
jgi:drug/metabolite transporter (DMT)-like permease